MLNVCWLGFVKFARNFLYLRSYGLGYYKKKAAKIFLSSLCDIMLV